jgi:hypothetical protein
MRAASIFMHGQPMSRLFGSHKGIGIITYKSCLESGIVPINRPPGRRFRDTFSSIIRAMDTDSKA